MVLIHPVSKRGQFRLKHDFEDEGTKESKDVV
jgi:hypothetical protein